MTPARRGLQRPSEMHQLRSGTAVFRTTPDGRIAEWNAAAEQLTGVSRADAEGRPCWEVIAGRGPAGDIVCHPGCSIGRLAREGWPIGCIDVDVPTPQGSRRLALSTIVLRGEGEPLVLHTLHDTPAAAPPEDGNGSGPELTPRQREILLLLTSGVRARQIAERLVLSETTVRNHIQSILLALGVHSQLEAVARARELTLADDQTAA